MSVAASTEGKALTDLERTIVTDIGDNEEQLFDVLRALVRFRTPNPPGGNEVDAQNWVEERLRAAGLEIDRWEVLPGRPNIVGILKGAAGRPSVTLNGHIDVCEDVLLDQWSSDPYEPVTEDRDMIGRGCTDMKCANASFMFAIETLQKYHVKLKGDVVFQSVIGEEAGEPGTRSAIERGYGGDFAIVGESSSGRGLVASLGVMNCRISIESPYTLHLVARKFTTIAGGAREGANCVEKMALRIIPSLTDLERQWAVFKTHRLVPPGACNINVFRIEGGNNTFILPDRCDAYVTITYLPHEKKESVVAEIEEQVARAAALDDWLRKYPPRITWGPEEFPIEFAPCDIDLTSEPVTQLQEAIRLAGGVEPVVGGRGGITDSGWFYQAGIPAVVFGPGDVSYAHAVDERVHLDDLVNHCKATAVFLLRYCGVADDEQP